MVQAITEIGCWATQDGPQILGHRHRHCNEARVWGMALVEEGRMLIYASAYKGDIRLVWHKYRLRQGNEKWERQRNRKYRYIREKLQEQCDASHRLMHDKMSLHWPRKDWYSRIT